MDAPTQAETWASDELRHGTKDDSDPTLLDALEELYGVALNPEQLAVVRAVCKAAFLAGAKRVGELESALDIEHQIRLRHEVALREAGLPVASDARPSEPPNER